jgi:acetyl-CoA carboxylase carboxyl transferase subunit alpha
VGVGDATLMLQYGIYSVISPEGCAAILWKTPEKTSDAAEALAITSARLKSLGLVDKVVAEPLGGAHRDPVTMMQNLRRALQDTLKSLDALTLDELLARRHDRLMGYGKFKENH